MNRFRWILFFLVSVSSFSKADIQVEIIGGGLNALPIAVLPFVGQSHKDSISGVVLVDLIRSGAFKNQLKNVKEPIKATTKPNYQFYRLLGVENVLTGKIEEGTKGRYRVTVTLHDVLRKKINWTKSWTALPEQFRQLSHLISDTVYESIVGIPGVFSHRIAYVLVEKDAKGKRTYSLQVSDSDGHGSATVLESSEPIISPAWSPDGKNIAYVSFENGRSEIYVQSLFTAKRQKIASHDGINSAPSWSHDGKKILMTLSKDGNSEIYSYDYATKALKRLTKHPAIDTEAIFSPDNKAIYFTSNRSGSVQIFKLDLRSNRVERVTHEGNYNAHPSLSKDGKYLAMISRSTGGFFISVLDLKRDEFEVISSSFLDESPAFAPNGVMLIYSAVNRVTNREELIISTVDGQSRHVLKSLDGDVRDPVWSLAPVL